MFPNSYGARPGEFLCKFNKLAAYAGQFVEIFAPGRKHTAQGIEVRIGHLNVEELKPRAAQTKDEVGKGNLRCIGARVEHRFPGKRGPYSDAVDAADELSSVPHLDAVSVP